jgi:hypothetical protein
MATKKKGSKNLKSAKQLKKVAPLMAMPLPGKTGAK